MEDKRKNSKQAEEAVDRSSAEAASLTLRAEAEKALL